MWRHGAWMAWSPLEKTVTGRRHHVEPWPWTATIWAGCSSMHGIRSPCHGSLAPLIWQTGDVPNCGWVQCWGLELRAIDLAKPEQPALRDVWYASLVVSGGAAAVAAVRVNAPGNRLFVAVREVYPGDRGGRLLVFDVEDREVSRLLISIPISSMVSWPVAVLEWRSSIAQPEAGKPQLARR